MATDKSNTIQLCRQKNSPKCRQYKLRTEPEPGRRRRVKRENRISEVREEEWSGVERRKSTVMEI